MYWDPLSHETNSSSAIGSDASIFGLVSFETASGSSLFSISTRNFLAFLMKSCWRVFDRYS